MVRVGAAARAREQTNATWNPIPFPSGPIPSPVPPRHQSSLSEHWTVHGPPSREASTKISVVVLVPGRVGDPRTTGPQPRIRHRRRARFRNPHRRRPWRAVGTLPALGVARCRGHAAHPVVVVDELHRMRRPDVDRCLDDHRIAGSPPTSSVPKPEGRQQRPDRLGTQTIGLPPGAGRSPRRRSPLRRAGAVGRPNPPLVRHCRVRSARSWW